jgi:hypothetical protein
MGYRILFLPSELAITPPLRTSRSWKQVEFIPPAAAGYVPLQPLR